MADMAEELRKLNVATCSLRPGCVSTESMKQIMQSEAKSIFSKMISSGLFKGEYLKTPEFSGKAVAALGNDPHIMKKSGKVLVIAELAREYGFTDVGGVLKLKKYYRSSDV
ncbi:dehydrogenase/reductase SDR family member 1-like [Xenia sp. Carnegie-2017]|uniref:dehydrogenase/reductase SDR family member 1-like n=1 Tax=Xenia sp. Carnegie-2017 TaxID=2897299 RepID=UPI001F03ACE6|nr:dehydrogenase/reductase SDR family member 1-like [Xenia sp. Carnegie-2017]